MLWNLTSIKCVDLRSFGWRIKMKSKIEYLELFYFYIILGWFTSYIFASFSYLSSFIQSGSFTEIFWRFSWYNWSGAQNMRQTIANFFSKLSLPKSLKRHPRSTSRDTNDLDGAMREIRDSSGSETDAHLTIYTEMCSPNTKLWWDTIKTLKNLQIKWILMDSDKFYFPKN